VQNYNKEVKEKKKKKKNKKEEKENEREICPRKKRIEFMDPRYC
jgi:hypothetical protein